MKKFEINYIQKFLSNHIFARYLYTSCPSLILRRSNTSVIIFKNGFTSLSIIFFMLFLLQSLTCITLRLSLGSRLNMNNFVNFHSYEQFWKKRQASIYTDSQDKVGRKTLSFIFSSMSKIIQDVDFNEITINLIVILHILPIFVFNFFNALYKSLHKNILEYDVVTKKKKKKNYCRKKMINVWLHLLLPMCTQ